MAAKKPPVVNCPTCGKTIEWSSENRFRPFCSERCKLIDLGQWATEAYRIPTAENEEYPAPPDQEHP
jgi:endogenous inhibitor of DNA gyrase (YacG/DUF329 family)